MAAPGNSKRISSQIPRDLIGRELILFRVEPADPQAPAYRLSLRDMLYRVRYYDPAGQEQREFLLNARARLYDYLNPLLRRRRKCMEQVLTRISRHPADGDPTFTQAGPAEPALIRKVQRLQQKLLRPPLEAEPPPGSEE